MKFRPHTHHPPLNATRGNRIVHHRYPGFIGTRDNPMSVSTLNEMTTVCIFSFGHSKSLFGVGRSLVDIENGDASLILSLKKEQLRGSLELLP